MAKQYRGCNLVRVNEPGKLKWSSYANGYFVAADTLEGIKECVREAQGASGTNQNS